MCEEFNLQDALDKFHKRYDLSGKEWDDKHPSIGASKISGTNRRCYPSELRPYNPTEILAVLVAGEIGDYACYVGEGSPEWVARFGEKISFSEACCHFPGGQLKKELYRN